MLVLLAWTSFAAGQTSPRQVLLLYSYEREFAPHAAFAKLFLPELSRTSPEPVEFIEVSLQPARESGRPLDASLVRHVQSMLEGRRPDLVVPIGGPAAVFSQRNRQQVFPSVPMLFAGVDRRFVAAGSAGPNDAVVAVDHEPARLVENILNVLPDTKTIFVVVGASQLEQAWLGEMRRAFHQFEGQVTFTWANDLSFDEMLARSARLPAHSAILFAIYSLDAKGVPHVEDLALTQLHAAANAPIFALRTTQLGLGIVGGPLMSIEDLSRNTAMVARHMLSGERDSNPPTQGLGSPLYDWRELRRWDIDETRLPSGSMVLFREPTMWQKYQKAIVAAATFVGVQAVVVVALVTNLARRRRRERTLRDSEGRFRVLSNGAPVMLWIADPEKRYTDVNRSWLEFTGRPIEAELGHGWTDSVHPDDLSHCTEIYNRAFDRREAFRREYRSRRSDGDYRWILDTGVPRFLDDGRFAGYVGSAIDVTDLKLAKFALARLSQRLMQAHEHERALVARELQDDLCQRLVVLTTQLHGLSQTAASDSTEEIRNRVEELSGQFATLASEIFSISDQLHSSNLERLGLAAAARIFCKEVSSQEYVTIRFQDEGIPRDLPNDVALTLFRVMQEAVGNAVKHSGIRAIAVATRGGEREIQLEVSDEGVGFEPDLVMKKHGLGLIGMMERMRLVDGECTIESRPGAGTRIRARVPLQS
jgi:PAS domain S-box-containing protein